MAVNPVAFLRECIKEAVPDQPEPTCRKKGRNS